MIVFDPIKSVNGQLKATPCPAAGRPSQVTVETPDKESDTLPVTLIPVVETIAPFAGDVMWRFGAVLSIFSVTDVVALFPALSIAVPEII